MSYTTYKNEIPFAKEFITNYFQLKISARSSAIPTLPIRPRDIDNLIHPDALPRLFEKYLAHLDADNLKNVSFTIFKRLISKECRRLKNELSNT